MKWSRAEEKLERKRYGVDEAEKGEERGRGGIKRKYRQTHKTSTQKCRLKKNRKK